MYLIYMKDHLVGFAKKKKLIKQLDLRSPGKYRVIDLEGKMTDTLLENMTFSLMELKYRKEYDTVYFDFEIAQATSEAKDRVIRLNAAVKELASLLLFIKFDDAELKVVMAFIQLMGVVKDDLLGPESAASMDDYFPMSDILDKLAQ